jgi:serine/threonine-protein kinase
MQPAAAAAQGAPWAGAPPAFAARPTVTEGQQPTCALCRQPISAPDLLKSIEHRGTWLCPRCSPRVEIPGYQIERVLGEGANGVVYLARWTRRGNIPVALKVLKTRGQLTKEERERFIREASVAAELEHRNIVRVYDLAEADPYLYYSMEFVQGKSLKEWIKEHGPLPLPAVLRIAVQVALALEHAREHNIVHRDIKPENILVQPDGVAKLTDFGLAKNIMTAGTSNLTRPGDGLGTLPFMPPEQIENALYADHRSDIYSFGASIYNMLTGRPPFAPPPGGRWTTLDYFTNIRDQPPPPIAGVRQDVPRVIQVMVEKALAKKPTDRYQQVSEMLALLQQFLRTEFDSRQTAT